MRRDVFLLGRGLACAQGIGVAAALDRLGGTPAAPASLALADSVWPYHAIPDEDGDWYARARRIVRGVVAECGDGLDRDAPLFLASSSLDVGALEAGAPFLPDCLSFGEMVADWIGWRGPVHWVSTACTASLNALLAARGLIRAGAARNALVLGLELRNRFSAAGFGAMQLLDDRPARPLARDRAGLALGEAVAALYLGDTPARWCLRGGANVVDGSNPAGATRAAMARMVCEALADAGASGDAIGLVKLQAAGSPHNDAEELHGLGETLGRLPPLTTLKPWLGHTLGASGAAEIALLTAALEAGVWPAPLPVETDPELAHAACAARPPQRGLILASILGFGGGHAGVVLEDRAGRRQ